MSNTPKPSESRNIPAVISQKIKHYQSQFRAMTIVEGLAETLTVFLALLIINLSLYRFFFFGRPARFVLVSVTAVATLVGLVAFIFLRLRKHFSDEAVAMEVEKKTPTLGEKLVSTVELLESNDPTEIKGSERLIQELASATTREVAPIDFGKAISWKRAAIFGAIAGVLATGLILWAVLGGRNFAVQFERVITPWTNISIVQLDVKPGDAVVEVGGALDIVAAARGATVQRAVIFLQRGDEPTQAFEMTRNDDNSFSFPLKDINTELTYSIRARDAESPRYTIKAQWGPRIKEFKLAYTYPAYTKQPAREATGHDGDISGVIGTQVQVTATIDREVRSAQLTLEGEEPRALALKDPSTVAYDLVITKDTTYKVKAVDQYGFATPESMTFKIKAMPNAAPTVKIKEPGDDLILADPTPVHVEYEATDDYGVHALRLAYQVKGAELKKIDLPLGAEDPPPAAGGFDWSLAESGIEQGDRIVYWLEAEDLTSEDKPHVTLSEKRHLTISNLGQISLNTPEFVALKKMYDAMGVLAKELEQSAAEANKMLAEYRQGKAWTGALNTQKSSLQSWMRDGTKAYADFLASVDALKELTKGARDKKDLKLVASVMALAGSDHEKAEMWLGTLPAGYNNEQAATVEGMAEKEAAAAETAAFVREQFAKIYDAHQMRIVLRGAQQFTILNKQIAQLLQSAVDERAGAAEEAERRLTEVQGVGKLQVENLGALTTPLPPNVQVLTDVRASLMTVTLPAIEQSLGTVKDKKFFEAKVNQSKTWGETREAEAKVSPAERLAARAAEEARVALQARLPRLAQQIAALAEEQKKLQEKTEQNAEPPKNEEQKEQKEKEQQQLAEDQKKLEEKAKELAKELEKKIDEEAKKPEADKEMVNALQQAQEKLQEIAKEQQADAAEKLENAEQKPPEQQQEAAKEAAQKQAEAAKDLKELAEQVQKIENANEAKQFAEKIDEAAREQQEVKKQTDELQPTQKNEMKAQAEPQRDIEDKAAVAEKQLEEMAKQFPKDSEVAKALEEAKKEMDAQNPAEKAAEAAKALEQGDLKEARDKQQQAAEALNKVNEKVQQAADLAAKEAKPVQEQLAKEAKPVEDKVGELAKEQNAVAQETKQAAEDAQKNAAEENAKKAADLAERQEELNKKAEDAAKQAAVEAMMKAKDPEAQLAEKQDAVDVAKAMEKAQEKMEEAKQKLEEVAKLDQEQQAKAKQQQDRQAPQLDAEQQKRAEQQKQAMEQANEQLEQARKKMEENQPQLAEEAIRKAEQALKQAQEAVEEQAKAQEQRQRPEADREKPLNLENFEMPVVENKQQADPNKIDKGTPIAEHKGTSVTTNELSPQLNLQQRAQMQALQDASNQLQQATQRLTQNNPEQAQEAARQAQRAIEQAQNAMEQAQAQRRQQPQQAEPNAEQQQNAARQQQAMEQANNQLEQARRQMQQNQPDQAQEAMRQAERAIQQAQDAMAEQARRQQAEQNAEQQEAARQRQAIEQANEQLQQARRQMAQNNPEQAQDAVRKAEEALKQAQDAMAQAQRQEAAPRPEQNAEQKQAQQQALEDAQKAQRQAAQELARVAKNADIVQNPERHAPEDLQQARNELRQHENDLPQDVRQALENAKQLEALGDKQEELKKKVQELAEQGMNDKGELIKQNAPQAQELANEQRRLAEQAQQALAQLQKEKQEGGQPNQDQQPPNQDQAAADQAKREAEAQREERARQERALQEAIDNMKKAQDDLRKAKAGDDVQQALDEAAKQLQQAANEAVQEFAQKVAEEAAQDAAKLAEEENAEREKKKKQLAEAQKQQAAQAAQAAQNAQQSPESKEATAPVGSEVVSDAAVAISDPTSGWDPKVRQELIEGLKQAEAENAPPEYEQLIKLYFKQLSESRTPPR
jgi:hypothetical protein